jgi:hypothetical protein
MAIKICNRSRVQGSEVLGSPFKVTFLSFIFLLHPEFAPSNRSREQTWPSCNCSIYCGINHGFPPSREWRFYIPSVIPAKAGIQKICNPKSYPSLLRSYSFFIRPWAFKGSRFKFDGRLHNRLTPIYWEDTRWSSSCFRVIGRVIILSVLAPWWLN